MTSDASKSTRVQRHVDAPAFEQENNCHGANVRATTSPKNSNRKGAAKSHKSKRDARKMHADVRYDIIRSRNRKFAPISRYDDVDATSRLANGSAGASKQSSRKTRDSFNSKRAQRSDARQAPSRDLAPATPTPAHAHAATLEPRSIAAQLDFGQEAHSDTPRPTIAIPADGDVMNNNLKANSTYTVSVHAATHAHNPEAYSSASQHRMPARYHDVTSVRSTSHGHAVTSKAGLLQPRPINQSTLSLQAASTSPLAVTSSGGASLAHKPPLSHALQPQPSLTSLAGARHVMTPVQPSTPLPPRTPLPPSPSATSALVQHHLNFSNHNAASPLLQLPLSPRAPALAPAARLPP